MAVDKSYGSGYKNTGMKKPVAPKAASAKLRKGGVKAAAKKYTSITTSKAKMLPGTSDYVAQENAARKQLGVAGLAARNRQLPAAARATARGLVREVTGVDISSKGIKVNPLGLAMALPVGKVLKAAKVLRAAGKLNTAAMLDARISAKLIGQGKRGAGTVLDVATAKEARRFSESVFPRLPSGGGVPGAKRSFDVYEDPLLEGAYRFSSGVKPGRKLSWNPTVNVSIGELPKTKLPKRGR